jgi:ubiquinone/menaquinone biosynthesis C-methylase UbiE
MEKNDDNTHWSSVDRSVDPAHFVNYLENASAMEFFQAYKRESYSLMNLKEGHCALDIGCGAGDDVLAMAQIVGNTGRIVGIDNSETMIAEAKKRAEEIQEHVEFRLGDAHNLDIGDNTFDCCRADRVFQHLKEPKKALSEMIRVARQGARIVVSEPDWETFVVDMPNKPLTRRILNYFCDETQNGWCGRELFRFFTSTGLLDISIIPITLVLADYAVADELFSLKLTAENMLKADQLTESECAEWCEYLVNANEAGLFFCAVTGFFGIGCKP